jgi:hypothetical protein
MTNPVPGQALGRLDIAYGKLALPDWYEHASALADAVGGLSDFYLHVDAKTGVYESAQIHLDPKRVVFGLIPAAVAPLVRMLQEQTSHLDLALANGWQLPPTEEPAWNHWHDRLARYVSSLERELANPNQPSERLWREVTAPLIQGIYPVDFDTIGIANPLVPSKPDVSTVPTTAFMVALQSQEVGRVQAWLLRWREDVGLWAYNLREMLRSWFQAVADGARAGFWTTAKVVTVGVLASGMAWVIWKVASTSADERRNRKTS